MKPHDHNSIFNINFFHLFLSSLFSYTKMKGMMIILKPALTQTISTL